MRSEQAIVRGPSRRVFLAGAVAMPFAAVRRRTRVALADPFGLAARLGQASVEEARTLVTEAMRAGLSVEGLNGAVLLAAVSDIPPRPMGGPLHAAMVVESAAQLTEQAPERERWLAALWCLEDYLAYRERIRAEGTWRLPEEPEPFESTEGAPDELVRALEEWDAPRADRALVALADRPRAELFALLRPFTYRCFAGFGHKLLYAVQLERVLERVDPAIATPVLRSLVTCLIHPEAAPETESFVRARELAAELPEDWEQRAADPSVSEALARGLRDCSPREAQEALAESLGQRLGPEAAWLGLRLLGTDLFVRRADGARRRHLPVHTVTELNAFDTARRRSDSPEVRAQMLLQAAAWLVQLRQAVEEQSGPCRVGEGVLDEHAPERWSPSVELLRVATQDHHLKYAAAALEEAARSPEPYRRHLLAAGRDYLPASDGDLAPRALEASRVLTGSGRG